MKLLNKILLLALLVACILMGSYIFFKEVLLPKKHQVQDVTIVLEKVQKVLKLVTVEGQFSELTKHEEWYGYNISPLRKKALIRINAKVLIGYDLDKMNLIIDDATKTILIDSFPPPEILSQEDEVEYYDIHEGLFTSFSKDDYTFIHKNAQEKIKLIALESGLLEKAEEQKKDMLDLLEITLKHMGWSLKISHQNKHIPSKKLD